MVGMEVAVVSAAVSGTLKNVANKLAPLLINEYSSIVGVQKDLQELNGQVAEVNSWLEKAVDIEKAVHKAAGNDPAYDWLKKLKDISYDVDDVVDEFRLKAEKHDADGDNGIMSRYLYRKPKSFIFQCKAASKIKAIKQRFATIVKQRTDLSAIANSVPAVRPLPRINNTTVEMPSLPIVDPALVFGRDEEKNKIISKLVETNDQQKIKIVSVIGLGGSGKTTMAKLVFNDGNTIKSHFEVRLWVYVSQESGFTRLVEKLYESIAGERSESCTLQVMSNTISNKLTGKRYLLVLDDVWTGDRNQWEEVMVHMKSGAPGSRILLTTRSREHAKAVDSIDLFDLPPLSDADGWQLFKQRFGLAANTLEPEFIKVGKEIVKKCGGVPLAIKALAGILRAKDLIGEWQAVRDSNLLDVECEACLMLSYFHLPSRLKQCFTICSLFPKGHKIDKEKLIDLWIAHDMISLEAGVDCLEYIGHKHFNSLVQMSFLQDVEEEFGTVICRMHDLVHDLARDILSDELSLIMPKEATSSAKSYRYLSLSEAKYCLDKNIFEKARAVYLARYDFGFGKALKNAKHLRSITVECVYKGYTESILTAILEIKNLRYLEISGLKCVALPEAISNIWSLEGLHLTHSDLVELPKSIGKLQKLRKLNLSGCTELKSLPDSIGDCHMMLSLNLSFCSKLKVLPDSVGTNEKLRVLILRYSLIKRLPSSITALRNLECLDLYACDELVELPEGIGNLEKLRVLNLKGCRNLRGMPVGIGQFSLVRNLEMFVVGEGKKYAQISELANLGRDSEDLIIRGIEHVMDPNDAHKACLKEKANLQNLKLHWGRTNEADKVNIKMEEAVLDGLEPPSGIKELGLDGYAGGRYAWWMLKQAGARVQREVPQFLCLTRMTLRGFSNLKHLGGLVELPCLEKLYLGFMPALESISGGPFPLLVKLVMEEMPRLGEVWMVTETALAGGEEGKLKIGAYLLKLYIKVCPNLTVKPYLPSSLGCLRMYRSNEQLLQLPGQAPSLSTSDAGFPPSFSYSHLKTLELRDIITSPLLRLESGRGWELVQHMSALESLDISWRGGLTELPESMRSLTSLRSLHINPCTAIQMLPEWLGELQSLQEMTIKRCDSLSSLPQSLGHLTSLRKLAIFGSDALHQLPDCLGELRPLRHFEINDFKGLTHLPQSMCRLTSLETLCILNCPGIISLPEGMQSLTGLQEMIIERCDSLSSLPQSLGHLTSLRKLTISFCHALHQFPECLGELRSLRKFKILDLLCLTHLPQSMCRLTSLETLQIWTCPGIKSLPEGIQGLTGLQHLLICGCPDLARRCKRGGLYGCGEDWHLISHIPHRMIGRH